MDSWDTSGDEDDLTLSQRKQRTLQGVFSREIASLSESQRCHGKRFADRLLADADAMYGPTGQHVPIHFPQNLKHIECFAVDMRGLNDPLKWNYLFEVKYAEPIDGVDEFVTTMNGRDIARILSCYNSSEEHHQIIIDSIQRFAITAQKTAAQVAIEKARMKAVAHSATPNLD